MKFQRFLGLAKIIEKVIASFGVNRLHRQTLSRSDTKDKSIVMKVIIK